MLYVDHVVTSTGNTLTPRIEHWVYVWLRPNLVFYLAARDVNETNNAGWQAMGTRVLPRASGTVSFRCRVLSWRRPTVGHCRLGGTELPNAQWRSQSFESLQTGPSVFKREANLSRFHELVCGSHPTSLFSVKLVSNTHVYWAFLTGETHVSLLK